MSKVEPVTRRAALADLTRIASFTEKLGGWLAAYVPLLQVQGAPSAAVQSAIDYNGRTRVRANLLFAAAAANEPPLAEFEANISAIEERLDKSLDMLEQLQSAGVASAAKASS